MHDAAGTSLFFYPIWVWADDDGKVRVLFQQHQNRTKDSCYAQKTSFFSFRMACEADVVEETDEVETTFSMETLFLSRLRYCPERVRQLLSSPFPAPPSPQLLAAKKFQEISWKQLGWNFLAAALLKVRKGRGRSCLTLPGQYLQNSQKFFWSSTWHAFQYGWQRS